MQIDPRIQAFIDRTGHHSVEVDGDTLTIRKRHVGETWLDNAGNWRGLSEDGETGPWNNERAAQHAADGRFDRAGAANLRRKRRD